MSEENRDPEIKVTDRRRFSPEGDPLDDPVDPVETEPERPAEAAPPMPPASFEFLVISLRWQAEMQLGMYGPAEGDRRQDLDGARHSIDLLGVLQEKTKGNLSWDEQRLLENSLTELRFRFVQAVEQTRQKP